MAKKKTDLPLYLFHQGTNYQAYKLLGAHAAKRGRGTGIMFTVWAPNATAVSVVGDFNNWDTSVDIMEKISEDGVWQTYVAKVNQFDTYKYAITTECGKVVYKSDPYAFHSETPPHTASKVYDISGYEWNDNDWLNKRKIANHLCSPINIYEVHLGSWRKTPDNNYLDYKTMAHELVDYVSKMGYTHIELLPVTEHPFDGSWGYQCTGYFAPTSRYGTPHDFMYFVDYCHQHDIGVILDWVPGHFPKDAFALSLFDGGSAYELSDPHKSEQPQWNTKVFDFGRTEVQSFIISSAMMWIEEYHMDGIRVDAVASMLYLDYGREKHQWSPNNQGGRENLEGVALIKKLNEAVLSAHPDVMMTAEESTEWPMVTKPPYHGGLGFNFKWNMGWMNDTLSYALLDPIFRAYNHDKLTFSLMYSFTENFILPISHDEVVHGKHSLIGRMKGDYWTQFAGTRLFLGYMFAHPGKKLNFMGTEFGQFIEWDYKKQLDWFLLDYPMHQNMLTYSKELNNFYKNNRPLWEIDTSWEGFQWLLADNASDNVVALRRIDDSGKQIIAVANFSGNIYKDFRIGVPMQGRYREVLNSDEQRFGGKGNVNPLTINSLPIKANNFAHSIKLTIAPMAIMFFDFEDVQ